MEKIDSVKQELETVASHEGWFPCYLWVKHIHAGSVARRRITAELMEMGGWFVVWEEDDCAGKTQQRGLISCEKEEDMLEFVKMLMSGRVSFV